MLLLSKKYKIGVDAVALRYCAEMFPKATILSGASNDTHLKANLKIKVNDIQEIIGEDKPDEGQISIPDKLRVSYFSQNVGEMKGLTALEVVLSGDAKVKDYDFVCQKLEAELAGESEIFLTVTETIDVSAAGESVLHFKGTGEITNQTTTGEAKVVKED